MGLGVGVHGLEIRLNNCSELESGMRKKYQVDRNSTGNKDKGGFTDTDRQSGRSMKHLRNWVPPYSSEICVSGFTCLSASMTLLSRMLSVMSVLFIETTETPAKVNESSYVNYVSC